MISYTITVQQTRGTTRRILTYSFSSALQLYGDFTNPAPSWIGGGLNVEAATHEDFYDSDGGYSFSYTKTKSGSYSDNNVIFSATNTGSYFNSGTTNSNLEATNVENWGETYEADDTGDGNPPDTNIYNSRTTNYQTLTPVTISVGTSTTREQDVRRKTTTTYNEAIITGTTSVSGTGTETTAYATVRYTFIESTRAVEKDFPHTITLTTTKSIETEHHTANTPDGTIVFPPRDTATVFHFFGSDNACVWVPTRSEIDPLGPLALTDIAESHTEDFTALPLYCAAKPLVIVDQSISEEFPHNDGSLPKYTYTTFTMVPNNESSTIYEKNSQSGFPLQSRLIAWISKSTTTAVTAYHNTFTANFPDLTEEWTEIFSTSDNSVEVIDNNLTYQEFPEFTYSTTRYVQFAYTSSYSESQNGDVWDNYSMSDEGGETIIGNYIERIYIRAFNPVKISHRETSFTYAWGLHASPAPEPKLAIETPAPLRWHSWAKLRPNVEVPYPTSSSWKSGNSSITASIAGNFITVTTQSGTDSNSTSGSQTYQFSGSGSAYTNQQTYRAFFTNFADLPDISFFGPHAATGEIETRARPGTYISIVQDSLGDFTLNTITLEESRASPITANAILYPAENSFYLTTAAGFYAGGGQPFTVTPRNPIP